MLLKKKPSRSITPGAHSGPAKATALTRRAGAKKKRIGKFSFTEKARLNSLLVSLVPRPS